VSDVNLFDVEPAWDEGDPEGYNAGYVRVGPLIGAKDLGLSVYELPPGESICPYHFEYGFDEWLIVLVGTPTLRSPDGEQELRRWDMAYFPDGADGAHKVFNRTETPVRVAILSNKGQPSAAVYPDSGKVGVWPEDKIFRLADAVDYFDGEVPSNSAS
jgi:uncharacterized cupin superfamily protein